MIGPRCVYMMYIYAKVMLYCVYNMNQLIFLFCTKITSMLVLMAGQADRERKQQCGHVTVSRGLH